MLYDGGRCVEAEGMVKYDSAKLQNGQVYNGGNKYPWINLCI
jgi:hypothetical protein